MSMRIYLLRHGRTVWNGEHRYQGRSDVPLSPEGAAELCRADIDPDRVWVSPLSRARQTARALFPDAEQVPVEALREMDFGAFEGRNYMEMEHDADYRAWVDGGCDGRCPGGEDWAEFSSRVCAEFSALVDRALEEGRELLVILAHGGVQMAAMEAFALPEKNHFQWQGPCAGGYVLEADSRIWRRERKIKLLNRVEYRKGERKC